MWSLKDLPTLTELFFGKGVDPATYKKEDNTPKYLSGKGKKKTSKKSTTKKKAITEVSSSTSKAKGKKAINKKLTANKPKTEQKQKDKIDLPF